MASLEKDGVEVVIDGKVIHAFLLRTRDEMVELLDIYLGQLEVKLIQAIVVKRCENGPEHFTLTVKEDEK